MTSELLARDNGRQALTINAEWPEVAVDYDDLLTEYRKLALPGFRPGKAPPALIEQRYRQQLRDDFTARCGRRLARQALRERNLRAAGPIGVIEIKFEPRREFSFTAEFVPQPRLEVPDYAIVPLRAATDAGRRDELSAWLLAHTPGEVPDALVRQETESQPGSAEWAAAGHRVKLTLILEQIAEAEGIEVDRRDVDARIAKVAAECGLGATQLRQQLEREDGLSRLSSLLRCEQTLNYLLSRGSAPTVNPKE